jgi:DNA-binding CsgD family transcriptional regulator/tetratricopeptide (TPR) repeat protein
MDDVRAAINWARGNPEVELEMLANLLGVWLTYAQAEGRDRIADALGRAPATTTLARARAGAAFAAAASVTKWIGPWAVTPQELAQMVEELGDEYLMAHQQLGYGYMAERQMGDLEGARRHLQAAVAGFAAAGATSFQAMAMGSLGAVEMQRGNWDEARRLMERAVELTTAVGDRYGSIGAHFHLGHYELAHGSNLKAIEQFMAGLEFADPADSLSVSYQVAGVACALAGQEPGYALRLFGAADRLRELASSPMMGFWETRVEQTTAQARAALPQREGAAAWAGGRALSAEAVTAELRERLATGHAAQPKAAGGLSRRELEIAELVAAGMTSRAISEKLFLSERTIETHLTHVMTKLNVKSRAQVAAWVAERRAAG